VGDVGRAWFAVRVRNEKLLLPPLADYTDYPYRRVMTTFDPPFIVTEMLSASAIVHGNTKTRQMLTRVEGARCEGVQLVGSDPEVMGSAAKIVEELGFAYIDINMGCTINKVARQGAGISLMGDEEKATRVASAVVKEVDIPVSCKMRLGLSRGSINAVSLSRKLEGVGVEAVTVHGRSGEKKWGMPVDFNELRRVVEAVEIPVVGNGGVFTGSDAVKMVEETGVAAVMPGRGIIGNPWLVSEIESALGGTRYTPPTLLEKKEICLLHMRYLSEYYGDKGAAVKMRRILPEYFTGCQNIRTLRQDVHETFTTEEVVALLDRIGEDGSAGFYSNR
jgi:tRNA-dihydrouridine synthase B